MSQPRHCERLAAKRRRSPSPDDPMPEPAPPPLPPHAGPQQKRRMTGAERNRAYRERMKCEKPDKHKEAMEKNKAKCKKWRDDQDDNQKAILREGSKIRMQQTRKRRMTETNKKDKPNRKNRRDDMDAEHQKENQRAYWRNKYHERQAKLNSQQKRRARESRRDRDMCRRAMYVRRRLRVPLMQPIMETTEEVRVFEIRIYSFNIKGISEYLKLITQGFWRVRASFSAVLGPWKTEINGLCEVMYIAQYDSLSHLLATRKKMLNHTEWTQFMVNISDLQMSFQNVLTLLAPGSELCTQFEPSDTAVYELQTYPENESSGEQHIEGTTVVGRFLSVYGPSKTEFCLLRYPDPDTAFTDACQRRATQSPGINSRLMVPVQVSNMN
ncbi:hypothetical protein ACOMHN_036681 [Nucella lapillus]